MTSRMLSGIMIGAVVGALVGAGSVLAVTASSGGMDMMGHMDGDSHMDGMMDDESMQQMHKDCNRHMANHGNETSPTPA